MMVLLLMVYYTLCVIYNDEAVQVNFMRIFHYLDTVIYSINKKLNEKWNIQIYRVSEIINILLLYFYIILRINNGDSIIIYSVPNILCR